MAQYSYCLVDLPQHVAEACVFEMSGIDGFGIALFGHGITDWSSAVQINAAIAAGKFYVVGGCNKNIIGEFPEGSPVEIPNPSACGPENILIGNNYQVNFTDSNVNSNNDDFYGGLPLLKGADFVIHYCEADNIRVISNKNITFYAGHATSGTGKENQKYSLSARWYQAVKEGDIGSTLYAEPEGIWCNT